MPKQRLAEWEWSANKPFDGIVAVNENGIIKPKPERAQYHNGPDADDIVRRRQP